MGLIRIATFSGREGQPLVDAFDAALDDLLDTPGLILDLRGNGGGDQRLADQMARRFLAEPFTYGREQYVGRLPQRGGGAGGAGAPPPPAPTPPGGGGGGEKKGAL